MKDKLKSLLGKPNVWLYLDSCDTWFREVRILEVTENLITFRFSALTNDVLSVWERTTRIENVSDIDIEISNVPLGEDNLQEIKQKLSEIVNRNDKCSSGTSLKLS